jgi:transmembrane sensor
MSEQHNEEIMIRYLQGTCSEEEKVLFETWLQASEENRKQFYEARLVWYASRIDYYGSEEQLNKALATFSSNIQDGSTRNRKRIFIQMSRYAAAAVVGILAILSVFLIWNQYKKNTAEFITTSVSYTDSSKLVVLNDGTRVWLNSNSSITYPRNFSDNERTVSFNGEAYFDVTHDPTHPFTINTSTIRIKVLGTAFNLDAYPAEDHAEAVLIRGKIAIDDSMGKNLAVITPGQMARFEKNKNHLTVKSVNPELYTSWRTGEITLIDASLKTITHKLSELYEVNFSIGPSVTDTARYKFSFSKRKPVTEVMEMLSFIAPIRYRVQGKNIVITQR